MDGHVTGAGERAALKLPDTVRPTEQVSSPAPPILFKLLS